VLEGDNKRTLKPVMRDYRDRETSNKRSSSMSTRSKSLAALICFPILLAVPSFAQGVARPPANAVVLDRSPGVPQNTNPTDPIANEISLLRKSLQTLNTRLQAISEELLAPATQDDNSNEKVKRIATNLDLLMHTEERAEVLRKQLIELIEKETSFKSRMAQFDEEMRPENIERALSGIGTTRTPELRDTRRRVLENERKGIESLLNVTTQSRVRLEEDVRQADQLVSRLRQRLFPLIEKEIDKINPN
jgi:hypothetical protein